MRPAPMLVWPTSELPIWPSGRPTAMPEALMVVMGYLAKISSRRGVLAVVTALPKVSAGVQPKPSMMQRRTGFLLIRVQSPYAVQNPGLTKDGPAAGLPERLLW